MRRRDLFRAGCCISCNSDAELFPGELPLIVAGACVLPEFSDQPYVQCHLDAKARPGFIVTPKRHVDRLSELDDEEVYAMWTVAVRALRWFVLIHLRPFLPIREHNFAWTLIVLLLQCDLRLRLSGSYWRCCVIVSERIQYRLGPWFSTTGDTATFLTCTWRSGSLRETTCRYANIGLPRSRNCGQSCKFWPPLSIWRTWLVSKFSRHAKCRFRHQHSMVSPPISFFGRYYCRIRTAIEYSLHCTYHFTHLI